MENFYIQNFAINWYVKIDFNGKFVVRIPKALQYKLTGEAKEEGISLNRYVIYKLNK